MAGWLAGPAGPVQNQTTHTNQTAVTLPPYFGHNPLKCLSITTAAAKVRTRCTPLPPFPPLQHVIKQPIMVVAINDVVPGQKQIGGLFLAATVSVCQLATDVVSHYGSRLHSWFFTETEFDRLLKELEQADSMEEWQSIADRLDQVAGNDLWRQNPESSSYDYKLIASRFRHLVSARKNDQKWQVAEIVRSGSLRNMGSIGNPTLYNHAFAGTKYLIEDYVVETIQSLDYLSQNTPGVDLSATDRQKRLDFFHDTRQSFGRTALILHGGALFGMCHLGIVKAMLENGLLPSVISGVTVGAAVAAFVCTQTPEDLPLQLQNLSRQMPQSISKTHKWYTRGVAEGVMRTFFPPEIVLFLQYVTELIGDMTFEEAYLVSGKVLNIPVLPVVDETKPAEGRLLNYLTTPKVLIRTAIFASIGSDQLPVENLDKIELMCRGYDGQIVTFWPYSAHFLPANATTYMNSRSSPYHRLSELFNVNNFLVSIARPYLAPVLHSDFKYRGHHSILQNGLKLFRTEYLYRLAQLSDMGLLPHVLQKLFVDENIPGGFQVNIVPEPQSLVHDLASLLDSHDIRDKVDHWIKIGERSVWPISTIIWTRTAIEYALDSIHQELMSA